MIIRIKIRGTAILAPISVTIFTDGMQTKPKRVIAIWEPFSEKTTLGTSSATIMTTVMATVMVMVITMGTVITVIIMVITMVTIMVITIIITLAMVSTRLYMQLQSVNLHAILALFRQHVLTSFHVILQHSLHGVPEMSLPCVCPRLSNNAHVTARILQLRPKMADTNAYVYQVHGKQNVLSIVTKDSTTEV